MYTYCITGGCGFIGTALLRSLPFQECQVRLFDSLLTGTREDVRSVAAFAEYMPDRPPSGPGVFLCVGDVRDAETLRLASQGADALIHLAANTGVGPSVENPRLDMESNVIGTFNALEAARRNGIKKFIFASSGAPAGEVTPPIHEEMPPHPVSPYGASKLAGEGYCSAYARTFGLGTVVLRFGNVYGPGSCHKQSVVAKFIRQTLAGEECAVYGDGSQTRDFIYIDDLTRALRLALAMDVGGEVFQIASGREHTVQEMAELLMRLLAERGIALRLRHAERRLGDVARNYADTGKAQRMLGWQPEYDLTEGLARTIDYFLAQHREEAHA